MEMYIMVCNLIPIFNFHNVNEKKIERDITFIDYTQNPYGPYFTTFDVWFTRSVGFLGFCSDIGTTRDSLGFLGFC
jgi:hypothetical protein